MNNKDVENLINDCILDLEKVRKIVNKNRTNEIAKFLTNYAVIRASGAIEQSFKTLIADSASKGANVQVGSFIDKNVRDSPATAKYNNICTMLEKFDSDWNKSFKDKVKNSVYKNNIFSAFDNLSKARNDVAHGKSNTISILEVITYFKFCKRAIRFIDTVLK